MATTGVQALPYPSLGDAANGPVAVQNLALAVEKKLVMYFATVTARGAALPAPTEGALAYTADNDSLMMYQDGNWQSLGGVAPTGANVPAPAATALPSAYLYGTTLRQVSADATWPNANGMVTTERTSDTRCWQTFRASPTANAGMWVRRANAAAGPWSSWESYVPWADTGYTALTYASPFTTQGSSAARARTLNGVTILTGLVRRSDNAALAASSSLTLANLGAFAPSITKHYQVASSSSTGDARLQVQSDGNLVLVTGATTGTWYSIDCSYTIDG